MYLFWLLVVFLLGLGDSFFKMVDLGLGLVCMEGVGCSWGEGRFFWGV